MHFKRLTAMLVVLLLIAVIAPLLILQPWRQPSQELGLLRRVEKRLNLPAASDRQEDDRGAYKDDKGYGHNSRRVTRQYNRADTVEKARIRLSQLGWIAKQTAIIGSLHNYMLMSVTDRTCIQLQADAGASDLSANRVVLMAASDDACSGYFVSIL